MELNNKIFRIVGFLGLLSCVFYFFHIIFGNMFYENYNPIAQAISDLTADNSSSKNIARFFSRLYGVFSVIFTLGFFMYFLNKVNKFINIGSFTFCFMTVISFIGYALFPLSESGYAGTIQDKTHMLVTILVVVFTIVSLILFIIGFIKSYKYMGIISLCTLILLIIGAMLINILPKEYFGIAERINVYSIIIYTSVLSIWMYKYIKNKIRSNVV